MAEQKVSLVTGVSSGIGRETAHELLRAGFRVFGTVRNREATLPEGVEPVILDLRDVASVEAGVAEVLARAQRIDALVNNAGATLVGALEETDTEQAQALFDVNFFGTVRMTQAVLPAMRARRAGRIVFVSSVVGFLPAPFMGFYAASKHALEGYSESLDHEIRDLGIRAILVQPGFMKTKIDKNAVQAARHIAEYRVAREKAEASINTSVEAGDDPALVAKAIREALTTDRPSLRYPVGKGARTLATFRKLMPAGLFDRALRRRLGAER